MCFKTLFTRSFVTHSRQNLQNIVVQILGNQEYVTTGQVLFAGPYF